MAIFSGEDILQKRLHFVYCLYFVVVKRQTAKTNNDQPDEVYTMRGIQEDATPCTTNEIQDLFFAMLECLKKVFDLQIPTKYKLNFFTNDLISNYKARCDPCMTFQVKSAEDP